MRTLLATTALAAGLTLGLGAIATDALAQGRNAPQAAVVAEQIDAKAIVESVDQTARQVLLRGEDGSLATIKVAPDVRNLAQVKAGDIVAMRIRLGVMAQIAPPTGTPVAEADIAGRAKPGERPAAFAGSALRVRVTFDSYDARTKTVSVTLPSGANRKTVLRTKQMQDFAATLKAGEKVDVTFAESIALAVMPAN